MVKETAVLLFSNLLDFRKLGLPHFQLLFVTGNVFMNVFYHWIVVIYVTEKSKVVFQLTDFVLGFLNFLRDKEMLISKLAFIFAIYKRIQFIVELDEFFFFLPEV